ncbi:hypothetical protein GTP44_25290 [Duganella sp. FT50W]|uniref:Uncharacterized protein n=1 Tax=Duganella lactea TaxID=2692173 RepID=A0A6L8MT65_9BURK|nr:hypothetical protein [Duganella lactea]MYM85240.1 hypothetical protein [Duganella lactea]
MKKSNSYLALAFGLALCACTTPAPKLTPEHAAAKRIATLNVYEDNTVALRTNRQYAWTSGVDILALEVDGQVYNAKDLQALEPQPDGRNTGVLTFAAGEKRIVNYDKLTWLVCTTAKRCNTPRDHFMTAMDLRDMLNPDRIRSYAGAPTDPREAFMKDSRAYPLLKSYEGKFSISSTDRAKADAQTVATILANWDSKAPQRAAENEAAKLRYEKENAARQAAIRDERVGVQTSCEMAGRSTPEISRSRQISCSRYGQTNIDEMEKLGWNVVSVSTQTGTDSIGILTFYSHRLTLQKVK